MYVVVCDCKRSTQLWLLGLLNLSLDIIANSTFSFSYWKKQIISCILTKSNIFVMQVGRGSELIIYQSNVITFETRNNGCQETNNVYVVLILKKDIWIQVRVIIVSLLKQKQKKGWMHGYSSRVRMGRSSAGEGHQSIWAGAVGSKSPKTPKKSNSRKSVRWSAVPVPCLSRLWLKWRG